MGKAIMNCAKSKNTELFGCDVFRMTAGKVGISEVRTDLLPEEKAANITALMKSGVVCMIGD